MLHSACRGRGLDTARGGRSGNTGRREPVPATKRSLDFRSARGGGGVWASSGVVGSQWIWVRPPAPWTASRESMPSQVEVLGQRPRHLRRRRHRTTPHLRRACLCRVGRRGRCGGPDGRGEPAAASCSPLHSRPARAAHNRCGLWAVRTAHRPHALAYKGSGTVLSARACTVLCTDHVSSKRKRG